MTATTSHLVSLDENELKNTSTAMKRKLSSRPSNDDDAATENKFRFEKEQLCGAGEALNQQRTLRRRRSSSMADSSISNLAAARDCSTSAAGFSGLS